jgi:hypothetical protein
MRLTIGVTGHRDLLADEVPALTKKVQDFFLQLKNDFPDLDLQLITPLAEGLYLLYGLDAPRLYRAHLGHE